MSEEHIEDDELEEREPNMTDALLLGKKTEYVRTCTFFEVPVGNSQDDYIIGTLEDIERKLEVLKFDDKILSGIESQKEKIEEEYNEDEVLSDQDGEILRTRISQARTRIQSNLSSKNLVYTEQKGLFNTEKALNNPESLFKEEIWDWMSNTAQTDIKEACKCLAIDCPTASMSMSLRAVEDCIRRWYKEETGNEIENTGWSTILDQLKSQFPEGSPEYLMTAMLDYQRGKRNSVSHPELTPDWRQANFILNTVQGTIAEIYDKMQGTSEDEAESGSVADEIEEAIEEESKENN